MKRAEVSRVSTTLAESKTRAFMKRRRFIFWGYDNYTDLEKEWIEKVKAEMLKKHGVDLGLKKPYGPRTKTGAWKEGKNGCADGTDLDFTD